MAKQLKDFPFWATYEGAWRCDCAYFDGELHPKIQDYGAVIVNRLEGDTLVQRSITVYPDSFLAQSGAQGLLKPGEGFEAEGTLSAKMVDENGTVDFGPTGGLMKLVDDHSAVRSSRDPDSGLPRYRALFTIIDKNRLNWVNQGFWSRPFEGDYFDKPVLDAAGNQKPNPRLGALKGFSVYRHTRIAESEIESVRAQLRVMHRVAVVATRGQGGGKPQRIAD
jgi:hypothetical protein